MVHKRFILYLICLMLLSPGAIAQEDVFSIVSSRSLQPFSACALLVTVPEPGLLTIKIRGKTEEELPIVQDLSVEKGRLEIPYRGLTYGGMALKKGKYTLSALLHREGGPALAAESSLEIAAPVSALEYALPKDNALYLEDMEPWFIDVSITGKGTVTVEIYDSNAMENCIHTLTRKTAKAEAFQLAWDGTAGKKKAAPGTYWVRVYAEGRKEDTVSLSVAVMAGKRPEPAIAATETMLPKSPEDDGVWLAMMQPMIVINKKATEHQKIHTAPSTSSASLGTVHGQSQGLMVLSADNSDFARVGAWRHEDGAYVEGYVPKGCLITVYPSNHYGLLIDKSSQSMILYEYGKPIANFPISTGLMQKEKEERETPAGAYLIIERISGFTREGFHYDYALRFDGGNLISQVGYKKSGQKADFEKQLPLLGKKASDGCVRVDYRTNDNTPINAYWLWTHLEYGTKVLVLDDAEARKERLRELNPGRMLDESNISFASPTPVLLSESEKAKMTGVLLSLAGDCVLGGEEKSRKSERSFDSVVAEKGMTWPFSGLEPIFSKDDFTLVNLEGVLQDHTKGKAKNRLYNFRGMKAYTEILKLGSVEQVNLANNHFSDYGKSGSSSTRSALNAAKIAYSGYQDLYVLEKSGIKIGFGGIRETVYRQNKKIMMEDIAALKSMGCDAVVYTCHFGQEYSRNHSRVQEEMAHQAIEAGANLVVGHHPHVVQGIETYRGGVILYSLGNFIFGGNLDLTEFDGCVVQAELLWKDRVYQGVNIHLLPVLTTGSAPENDFRPIPAPGDDKARIFQKMQDDTSFILMEDMFFPAK